MIEPSTQEPTNMEGVAIHLSYLRRDMKIITDKLDSIVSNYVPTSVFLENKTDYERRITSLEDQSVRRKEFEDSWKGRVWGINTTIGLIIGGLVFLAEHFLR